ncbi:MULTISPECIES: hypothetical protein [Marinobacter]|uniref:hypothetical protein n=1 Tax=Marinobacter TaxID=2742 RepID=UPI001268BB7B
MCNHKYRLRHIRRQSIDQARHRKRRAITVRDLNNEEIPRPGAANYSNVGTGNVRVTWLHGVSD